MPKVGTIHELCLRHFNEIFHKSGILLLNKETQAERKINFACMIISDKSTKQID
ncbi:hypothetical protein [Nostoc sp.]|uniref:hypothetical protein n=1 Tax=Nostoc sp. TaxID=1180 RepID=UPI002FFC16A9